VEKFAFEQSQLKWLGVALGGTPGAPARAPRLVAPSTLSFRAVRAFSRHRAFPRAREHRGDPKLRSPHAAPL
jgi:hypothetical protein